ncbi:MAG: A/G-specific adenine glycosylase, partial [Caldilineaceae bacterium]|nr:A/G-specific adenine glycosylase [Caldilineaceae bacterium]
MPMNHAIIARLLVDWHGHSLRELPWRHAAPGRRDPYTVWVSEIMAQQTRLETVVDYYERWMARFPTVEALADADQQAVLTIWQGLGYYARARNFHRAAQQVMARFGGRIPDNRHDLLTLPGVGAYTAGAILSLAFGQAEPVVDGNVKRLFSRLFDIEQPIQDTATQRELWRLARELVQMAGSGKAGHLNEALMEMGATICVPASPRCLLCRWPRTAEPPSAVPSNTPSSRVGVVDGFGHVHHTQQSNGHASATWAARAGSRARAASARA